MVPEAELQVMQDILRELGAEELVTGWHRQSGPRDASNPELKWMEPLANRCGSWKRRSG